MSQIRFEEQQYNTESLDAGLWKRIFVLMRPLRKELVRLLILMVAVAGCDVLFPILNKIAIDTFAAGGQPDSSLWSFPEFTCRCAVSGIQRLSVFHAAGKIEGVLLRCAPESVRQAADALVFPTLTGRRSAG